jgi:hypothetical protein
MIGQFNDPNSCEHLTSSGQVGCQSQRFLKIGEKNGKIKDCTWYCLTEHCNPAMLKELLDPPEFISHIDRREDELKTKKVYINNDLIDFSIHFGCKFSNENYTIAFDLKQREPNLWDVYFIGLNNRIRDQLSKVFADANSYKHQNLDNENALILLCKIFKSLDVRGIYISMDLSQLNGLHSEIHSRDEDSRSRCKVRYHI